ncbi:Bacterial-type extracellular deoxyribonuclease [Madurella fahalii]|uniref:Bacterial-type extracellular deoxyribonuclease n=1 Tax=Madurella fahalii TaxID=1157608 RepID=A0ABQ0GT90_9PEZI
MKSFIVGTVLAMAVSAIPMPAPSPPGIPSASTAKSRLASLTVKAAHDDGNYDRELFPHWNTVSGSCNAREYVLKRDGSNVVTNDACGATSGTWFSPFDGATWTAASDVDIDHMVPLKNAWISGANTWSTAKRTQFANDINTPQLWAVTDDVNQAKGDKSPDQWKPPLRSFYCTYSKSWVAVKYAYGLSITSAEKSALTSMLNTC